LPIKNWQKEGVVLRMRDKSRKEAETCKQRGWFSEWASKANPKSRLLETGWFSFPLPSCFQRETPSLWEDGFFEVARGDGRGDPDGFLKLTTAKRITTPNIAHFQWAIFAPPVASGDLKRGGSPSAKPTGNSFRILESKTAASQSAMRATEGGRPYESHSENHPATLSAFGRQFATPFGQTPVSLRLPPPLDKPPPTSSSPPLERGLWGLRRLRSPQCGRARRSPIRSQNDFS
jgi:hypothetical protein